MRRMLALVFAVSVSLGMLAMAQTGGGSSSMDKPAPSAPLKTIKGTVKSEGGKITFVSDKDKRSWDVTNPDALKGHEGHHVQLKAHIYADKGMIHVMEVKMMPTASPDQNAINNPETRY